MVLRIQRCDAAGPYRLPEDRACAIDQALDRFAIFFGSGDAARGLLDEVASLREVTVEVGQREMRWAKECIPLH